LGTQSASPSRIAVLAINNAGTIELAAVNAAGVNYLDESRRVSTTAEGGAGAADSASVIYSTTARTDVAFRVIGFIESTQATAGTWATTPSTIQGKGGTVQEASRIYIGTAAAATSGTSVDITGIPNWVKRITVMLDSVSTNGTSAMMVQIGDAGGVEATGYLSAVSRAASTATATIGFLITDACVAADTQVGFVTLTLVNYATNTWAISGSVAISASSCASCGGLKSLSAPLDRVRLTMFNGTDAFDGSGSFNILYE
jgi:hypothetical protein